MKNTDPQKQKNTPDCRNDDDSPGIIRSHPEQSEWKTLFYFLEGNGEASARSHIHLEGGF